MKERRQLLPPTAERIEAFWSHVDIQEGCWLWRGRHVARGYGLFGQGKRGSQAFAHRVSWLYSRLTDPGPLLVLHRCDNPACVRPSHLFLGTNADNVADMVEKGRQAQHDCDGRSSVTVTAEDVRQIRALFEAGEMDRVALAARFRISRQVVYFITTNRSWRADKYMPNILGTHRDTNRATRFHPAAKRGIAARAS